MPSYTIEQVIDRRWYNFHDIKQFIQPNWKVEITGGDLNGDILTGWIYKENGNFYCLHNDRYHDGGCPSARGYQSIHDTQYSWSLSSRGLMIQVVERPEETPPTLTPLNQFQKEIKTMQTAIPSDPRDYITNIDRQRQDLLMLLTEKINNDIKMLEQLLMQRDVDGESRWITERNSINYWFGAYRWSLTIENNDYREFFNEKIKKVDWKKMEQTVKILQKQLGVR